MEIKVRKKKQCTIFYLIFFLRGGDWKRKTFIYTMFEIVNLLTSLLFF